MRIHVGTSGYGYREWKGRFYPDGTSPKQMLNFYAERLGAVEINNTFYHMPTQDVLLAWAGQVPEGFVFALKAPQVITHRKRLKNVQGETEYLFRTLPALGAKLGPVLFQFPANFPANRPALAAFFALVPGDIDCAFEFRSPSWHTEEILGLLRERGCGLCIADTDENPAGEIVSTAPWGYLRLRRSDYGENALIQWRERILAQKWTRAFVFFKHEQEAKGPEMAMRFRALTEGG